MIKHVAKCDGCGREIRATKEDSLYKPPADWIQARLQSQVHFHPIFHCGLDH